MKSFNRNDGNVKDQILRYLKAIDVDNLLTIEIDGISPAFSVTLHFEEFNLTSKKLNLTYDFYSIYVTSSDENWILQSLSRIKKIQMLMNLEQVDLVKVDDLINYGMKASGFLETRTDDRINCYDIFITFDDIEVATTVTKSNLKSTVSSRSYVQMRVTDSVEEDFKEFENLVLSSLAAD